MLFRSSELAEVDFERVRRGAEHVNIRAGAEDSWLEARDDDCAHLRVLEANPLDGVGELDIDAEVVRVELQLITVGQRLVFLDVHRERRDASVDLEFPVTVLVRRRLEADYRIFRI